MLRRRKKVPTEAEEYYAAVVRSTVVLRARHRCERCGEDRRYRLDLHHKLPRSRGGKDTPENLFLLCRSCHDAVHDHRAPDWREWIACGAGGS